MEFLQDPNVIYLLLMAGLWISATGTYIPGTGIAEIAGAGLILGTVYLMSLLAANWLAVIALVAGASLFFLVPLLKSEWENLAIGGLALQAVASFFLFAEASVSPLADRCRRPAGLGLSPDDLALHPQAAARAVLDAERRISRRRAGPRHGDH